METVTFEQVVSRGCGIDVHKILLVATISGEGIKTETREFGTVTRSLTELKDWLLENGVTHVVMKVPVFIGSLFITSWNPQQSRSGLSMPVT